MAARHYDRTAADVVEAMRYDGTNGPAMTQWGNGRLADGNEFDAHGVRCLVITNGPASGLCVHNGDHVVKLLDGSMTAMSDSLFQLRYTAHQASG